MHSNKWKICYIVLFAIPVFFFYRSTADTHPPKWSASFVTSRNGHYPHVFCSINGVVFDPAQRRFVYVGDPDMVKQCTDVTSIWPLQNTSDIKSYNCDRTFEVGYAFTFFYWHGSSNYYHITLDTMIPLYKQLYYNNNTKRDPRQILLMPTVESRRLQELTWNHDAFQRPGRYWSDMIQLMTGHKQATLMPLDEDFLAQGKTFCFDQIYFGTPSVKYSDKQFIRSFIQFVKSELGIQDKEPTEERMILIARKGRRKILNEQEIVDSLQDVIPVDLVDLATMNFKQQVEAMQKYTIFAALNGAGLMNALYLPWYAVAIQLVPYKAGLNFKQYGELLLNRGPTLEWHNQYENLTREMPNDPHRNRPDTIVHLQDFKEKVKYALQLARDTRASKKEEL